MEASENYLLSAMERIELSGHSYVSTATFIKHCQGEKSRETVIHDLNRLIKQGELFHAGNRLYSQELFHAEAIAAEKLSAILQNNQLPDPQMQALTPENSPLCTEQCQAVALAGSYRLSLILGGAGTGKTTVIKQILATHRGNPSDILLAAPTGKATVNLREKTGMHAVTLHSALSVSGNPSPYINWQKISLVVIDEASMMTTCMLAGLLSNCPEPCRIVLVGDPQQLLSVGAGNVIPDLLELGFPAITLREYHRQSNAHSALAYNIRNFSSITNWDDLRFDTSFQLLQASEEDVQHVLYQEAVRRYCAGEDVQLLTTTNHDGTVCVQALNDAIQPAVHPRKTGETILTNGRSVFCDGDRILVTQNLWDIGCCNGEVSTLRLSPAENTYAYAALDFPNGRSSYLFSCRHKEPLCHGYALTVYKSQGSEYDTILLPITGLLGPTPCRNLLYTAISRAKKQVILVGDFESLDLALHTPAPARRSSLVEKTLKLAVFCA